MRQQAKCLLMFNEYFAIAFFPFSLSPISHHQNRLLTSQKGHTCWFLIPLPLANNHSFTPLVAFPPSPRSPSLKLLFEAGLRFFLISVLDSQDKDGCYN